MHTEYDQLLRIIPWNEARRAVETKTLERIIQWRGDDDADSDVMHDVLREVIIISDDEDGDEPDVAHTLSNSPRPHRPERVEVLPANHLHTRPLNLSNEEMHESELQQPAPFVRSSKNPFLPDHRIYEDRVDAQRIRRWEEALRRHQNQQNENPQGRSEDFKHYPQQGLSTQQPGYQNMKGSSTSNNLPFMQMDDSTRQSLINRQERVEVSQRVRPSGHAHQISGKFWASSGSLKLSRSSVSQLRRMLVLHLIPFVGQDSSFMTRSPSPWSDPTMLFLLTKL